MVLLKGSGGAVVDDDTLVVEVDVQLEGAVVAELLVPSEVNDEGRVLELAVERDVLI